MFKCNSCNRSFKTRQALGGHVSRAHPKSSVSAADSPPEATLKEETIVEQPAMTGTVVPAPGKEETTVAQPVVNEVSAPALIPAEVDEANAVPAEAPQEAGEIPASKAEEEEETQSEQIQRYLKRGILSASLPTSLASRRRRCARR